jgi:hypothetical protein
MTTASEVKRWVRPLLERRPDLVLVGRNLVIKPVQHIVRGIYFDASWDKTLCRPRWYVNKAFNYYGEKAGFSFQHSEAFSIGRTYDPSFNDRVISKTEEALALDFSKVRTISEFLDKTDPVKPVRSDIFKEPLRGKPHHYAAVLAALGRVAEAREVLAPAIEKLERSRCARLAAAEKEFARRKNSAIAKLDLKWAGYNLDTIARLQPLLVLLENDDRAGIAALLRQWEEETVRGWKLEHLWEPTPFPIELGAGD